MYSYLFVKARGPLDYAIVSGTSKLVQVLLEKSPPAALPDAGLIVFISFLTIAFFISPCEQVLDSILLPFSPYTDLLNISIESFCTTALSKVKDKKQKEKKNPQQPLITVFLCVFFPVVILKTVSLNF